MLAFLAAIEAALLAAVAGQPASFRLEYPPWGEPGTPAEGQPRFDLPILIPLTNHGCGPSRYMAMRIAASHINRRDATLCPAIAELNSSFEVVYEVADSGANGIGAMEGAIQLQERMTAKGRRLVVVLGPNSSGSSKASSAFLAVMGVPQLSWAATSSDLSSKSNYPNFFRVVAPDSIVVQVLARMLDSWGIGSVNVVYFDADFQTSLASSFQTSASIAGLDAVTFRIPNSGQGGASVSEANRPMMTSILQTLRRGTNRAVIAFTIGEEAYDVWQAAHDLSMLRDSGWLWLGTDGINGNQLAGSLDRARIFSGSMYIMAEGATDRFSTFATRWQESMRRAEIPEFFNMSLCRGGSVCAEDPGFRGWEVGLHDEELMCTGYTGLAYDAFVTVAVVLDRLLARTGRTPDELTKEEWMEEMRGLTRPENSLTCLTGEITLDENHDRLMPMAVHNWQGQLTPVQIGSWSGVTGFTWRVGETVAWPSGATAVIQDTATLPQVPSGQAPTCAAGEYFDGERLSCQLCPSGTYMPQSNGTGTRTECFSCAAGRYTAAPGMTECLPCGIGSYSPPAASQCTVCPAGSAASREGSSRCQVCLPGQAAPGNSSSCHFCSIGSYSDVDGAEECTACAVEGARFPLTTFNPGSTSSADCICPAGSFASPGTGSCEECPPGMICRLGSNTSHFSTELGPYPEAKPGHMSRLDAPLQVFKCGRPGHCPGGAPGTCAPYRDAMAVACGRCESGAYEVEDTCEKCQGFDALPFVVAALLLLVAVAVMTVMVNRDVLSTSNSSLMVVAISGVILNSIQAFGIFSSLRLEKFEPMATLMRFASLLSFDLRILRIPCVIGSGSVVAYAVRQCVAPAAVPLIFLTLLVKKRFKPQTSLTFELVNSTGTIFMILFLPILLSVVTPMICYQHPGDIFASMVSESSILCFEGGDHTVMLIVALVALLVVPLPFLSVVVWATLRYPYWCNNIGQGDFILSAFRFLFFRFHPPRYYYGSLLLLRSFLLCMVPIVIRDNVALQVSLFCTILLVFLVLQLRLGPWRGGPGTPANDFDAVITATLLLLLMFGSMATDFSTTMDSVKVLWTILIVLFAVIGISALVLVVRRKLRPSPHYSHFICHHKAAAAAQARLIQLMLQTRTSQKVFIDSDDLVDLDLLFDTVKTRVAHLVVYLTRDTLRRPWCSGEIVTAFASRVGVTTVRCPSFAPYVEADFAKIAKDGGDIDFSGCDLSLYGIASSQVADAYRLLLSDSTPRVDLDPDVRGLRVFENVVSEILAHHHKDLSRQSSVIELPHQPGALLISVEVDNHEATAAAGILTLKIKADLFGFSQDGLLVVADYRASWEALSQAVQSARAVVVLLTPGTLTCMQQLTVMSLLMKPTAVERFSSAADRCGSMAAGCLSGPAAIPLQCPGFEFPQDAYWNKKLPQIWLAHEGLDAALQQVDAAREHIQAFFHLIAIQFPTASSDNVLDTQATEVLQRVPKQFQKQGVSVTPQASVGNGNGSPRRFPHDLEPADTLPEIAEVPLATSRESYVSTDPGKPVVAQERAFPQVAQERAGGNHWSFCLPATPDRVIASL